MIRKLARTTLFIICCAGCSKGAVPSSKDNSPAIDPVAQITIVGCVQPADQTATNAVGSNDTKYMLTHAKSGNRDANAPTGTSGSSTGSRPSAGTYRLNGSDTTLSPEVGHQVEIVAVVEDREATPAGTAGRPGTAAPAPKLKVETIKMIAVPCPE
jgi:hypothetical protein